MSVKIGCQTITFGGDRHKSDIEGIFKTVKDAGYDGIEFGYKRLDPQQIPLYKELFEKYSLIPAALHTTCNFRDEESEKQTYSDVIQVFETAKALGCKDVFTSGDRGKDMPGYYARAGVHMSRIGKIAKDYGVIFSFHNHSHVIEDNARGLYDLAENSDPANLAFALDIGWIARGGANAVEVVTKLLNRVSNFHFKEFTAEWEFTEVGKGIVDFKGVYELVRGKKDFWIISEQDQTKIGADESVRQNLTAIREIIK